MNKLKTIMLCTALGALLTTSLFAKTPPSADVKAIINEFAESHINSDAAKMSKVLSYDVILKTTKGNQIQTQDQKAILNLLRQSQGIKQNCSTKIDVISSSDAMVVAKVSFIYENFVIENLLTLELDKNQKWLITRIDKFFA